MLRKKKLPNPVGKKGPSDYQASKSTVGKTEIISLVKKQK